MSTDPSLTATADQLAMHARADLTQLTAAIARGDAEKGEAQNGADFTRYLADTHTPEYLAVLVITAVRRIRELEQEERS